ncbi:MAG: DUF192 domain-containing protein [Elusimicrobium sp.]|jgi:uncharacterized membrane protein (UPF0127 family)|nr:DUF192 domain-containing protein [Elusimicrobium sp.]
MKRFIFLPLIFLAACGGTALPVKTVILPNGKKIEAETAVTKAQQARGLMYRENLDEDKGMLFIFDNEQPLVFWMKNTFIDLDMIFMGADKTIRCIGRNIPRSTAFTEDGQAATFGCDNSMYVLEIPAGAAQINNIAVGDKLEF